MSQPRRMCLGCGAKRAKAELVRLVVDGGLLVVDQTANRLGRGGYLCPAEGCMEKLLKSREDRLKRVFRTGQQLCRDGLREQLLRRIDGSMRRQVGEKQYE